MKIPIHRKILIYQQKIETWENTVVYHQIDSETADLISDDKMKSVAVTEIKKGLTALKGLREGLAQAEDQLNREIAEAKEEE